MTEPRTHPPAPPDRPADAHKGTFGTVAVIGGSAVMPGAAALGATAALRGGAGRVRIAAPANVLPLCLTIQPSATGIMLPANYEPRGVSEGLGRLNDMLGARTVLAIGPGMGVGPGQQRLVQMMLRQNRPVVLDADGLNNLVAMGDGRRAVRCPLVMTPHPGEYRRLARPVALRLDPTDPDTRLAAAEELARAYGATVVLKGALTIVADSERHYVNHTGNPALATAGTGDVLTGLIAALIAQGMELFDAAALGTHLHGLAADLWARRHSPAGLLAMDAANWIPHAIAEMKTATS